MTEYVTRKVILHYHLFKNAGTSVDALLQYNFPDQWVTKEFESDPYANRMQVEQWILENPQAVCFSSHTAMLPPPDLPDVQVLPIIFVRHPIDRIASAYAFEAEQGDEGFGAVLARNTTLKGYIEIRLALGDRQCRNFQVSRFAEMFKDTEGDENERALRAQEELPFVGLVEKFEQSVNTLSKYLERYFSNFHALPITTNVSREIVIPIEKKLEIINETIGEECFSKLIDANTADMALYRKVKEVYGNSLKVS